MFDLILQKIGTAILVVGITVSSWFGVIQNNNTIFGASTESSSAIALFETTLASRITDTATTMTLTSATDKDGNTLASSTYGMIIDEGTASEEIVLADCTSTACTNITRGLSVRTGTTTVSALKKEHRRGASVKITDAPALIFANNVFRGKQNVESLMNYNSDLSISSTSRAIPYASWVIGQTNTASTSAYNYILGTANTFSLANTFSATTTFSAGALTTTAYDCQNGANTLTLCSKAYVDSVAVAGASNADTSTKGIVEEATVPEINSHASTGGTGAKLFMTPASFAYSSFASSSVSYATSTNSDIYLIVPVLSAQVVKIWGRQEKNNCAADGSLVLSIKYSFSGGATSTLTSGTGANSATYCEVSLFGPITAASDGTFVIQLEHHSSGNSTNVALMAEI